MVNYKASPRTIQRQRLIEIKESGCLKTILSRKTLKTGKVKQTTIISIAARQTKLAVEVVNPKGPININRCSCFDFCPRIKGFQLFVLILIITHSQCFVLNL